MNVLDKIVSDNSVLYERTQMSLNDLNIKPINMKIMETERV